MKKPILALLLLAVATALTVPVLASPTGPSAAIGTPDAAPPAWTAEEMQAVYELNLVRRQPEVWGIENGVDLRGVTALPPLAPNNLLAGSADLRAEDLAATGGYYQHQMSPPDSRWPNQVAYDFSYLHPFPLGQNWIESYAGGMAVFPLASLLSHPTHRDHLLSWISHREVGIGFVQGNDELWWVIHTGYIDGADPFLTGVAYDDTNQNGVMDLGEGLAGVTVVAGGRSTTTNAGGGWALQVPGGTYSVTASGAGFAGTSSTSATVGSYNVGVDFVSGKAKATVVSYGACSGYEPTILGSSADDIIYGTAGNDVILAGPGNDTVFADDGADVICAGSGNDAIWGGAGNDTIHGEDGKDLIRGNAGKDWIHGGSGADILYGNNGRDRIKGNKGDDTIYGNGGNDRIRAGNNDDIVDGGADDDIVWGNDRHDDLYGGTGNDSLNGGTGTDFGNGGGGLDSCSNLDYAASCEA